MDKKLLKDLAILVGVIIIASIGARVLAGGETLSDYANKNPEKAGITSSQGVSIEAIEKTISETNETAAKTSEANSGMASSSAATDAVSNSSATASSTSVAVSSASTAVSSAATTDSNIASAEGDSTAAEASTETTDSSADRVTYQEGFYYEPIPNEVFSRISGISYPVDCTVPLSDLRYVAVKYMDFNDNTQSGEIICNRDLAQDLVEIFYELYTSGYQIESIKLIDEFGGDDEASMKANNSSCFNYRVIAGTTRLSNHATGRAIDINPFYNPYITYKKDGSVNISPEGSEPYADRDAQFPYKIDENDLAYKLFKAHGFKWGGDWNSVKDYQHFER